MTDKQRILIGKFLLYHSLYTDISGQIQFLNERRHDITSDAFCLSLVKSIEACTAEEIAYRQEQAILHGNVSLTDLIKRTE